ILGWKEWRLLRCPEASPVAEQRYRRRSMPPSTSKLFLENLAVLLQPCFCFLHRGDLGPDDIPKPRCVIAFDEVGEFVNDHVIDHKHRSLNQAPIKTDVVFRCAGAPPIAVIGDPCRCISCKPSAIMLDISS